MYNHELKSDIQQCKKKKRIGKLKMYQLPYLNYKNVRRNTKQMIIDQLFLLLLKLQKVTKYKICIFESNKHKANKKKKNSVCMY